MRKTVRRLLKKTVVACLIAAMLVGVMPVDMLQVEMGKVKAEESYPNKDWSSAVRNYRIYQQRYGDCAIASIASIEAYHRQTTSGVYDAVYSKNSNKVSIQSWSAMGYTTSSYSLTNLYNALKTGPCIIARSTPHYSVVVAYEGSTSTLEASGFKVMEIVGYNKYDGGIGHPTAWLTDYDDAVKVPLSVWGSYGGGSLTQICTRTTGLGGNADTEAPVISNVQVTNLDSTGYTVSCTITDNVGVASVTFPTWTDANGQDDLPSVWPGPTSSSGSTYTYRVNISDHNNETGGYTTHIYAYDAAGNYSVGGICATVGGTLTINYNANGALVDTTGANYSKDIATYKQTRNYGGLIVNFINFSSFGLYKTGYHRRDGAEWNTKANGGGTGYDQDVDYEISDIADISSSSKNVTVYAQWDPNVLSIKYGKNGGSVDTGNAILDIDTYTTIRNYGSGDFNVTNFSSFGLTRPGYVRKDGAEWNTKADGSGISYDQDVDYPISDYADLAGGNKTITLYAQWDQTDFEAPVISNFTVSEITSKGFIISCDVTDNVQVSSVDAIVRAEEKDVEDVLMVNLQPSGNTYSGYVDLSEYHSEKAIYQISIGATDIASNHSNTYATVEHTSITSFTLSETEMEVALGETKILEATISPAEGLFPDIIWTSFDDTIATVSDGVITGVAAGTTTITAECGGKTATCMVTVVKPFESITLNITDVSLFKNEMCRLAVSYAPEDATASKDLVWTSSNPKVASVTGNGVVTAQSAGSAEITVALESDSAIVAKCVVNVESYLVTFDTNGGSSIASIECGKNETLTLDQEPVKEGYAFLGWYKDKACTVLWKEEEDVVNSDITLYAGWIECPEGLWTLVIHPQEYTGKAIKPEPVVYHGAVKLVKGKDYTVSYKNNVKAADENSAKAPTVIVKGKGNYSGKETVTFTIWPKSIYASDIEAADLCLSANGKVQTASPVVKWNGKKLKKNTDYTVEYPDTSPGAYQNSGTYPVKIVGKGNFSGERTIWLQITGANLFSKVKVSKIPNQAYTGKAIRPEFVVKSGSTILTEGVDYQASYENNTAVGTATVTLIGMGNYTGEKTVTFKIVGISIGKAKVTGLPESVVYDGSAVNDVEYELQMVNGDRTVALVENEDYTVSYKNNSSAGTATITFKGINGYSGTLKKTFKITAYDIGTDTENTLNVSENLTVAYMKGNTVIEPRVTCFGKTLKKGKDYNLTFKNNKALSTGAVSGKEPTVSITGKGNYKGCITLSFTITEQNIGLLSMTATDKAYQSKAGKCISKPVIKDVNGKNLTAGTDYEKNLVYTYTSNTTLSDGTVRAAGSVIEANDILPAGTSVTVTAKGKGNYTGEISCTYRIVQADISKAKGKIAAQIYTGKAIEPGKSDITLKMGKVELANTDYEIVSYSNNIKKGTATMVVKGVGNYGGTKKITFKIKSKIFSWWWR